MIDGSAWLVIQVLLHSATRSVIGNVDNTVCEQLYANRDSTDDDHIPIDIDRSSERTVDRTDDRRSLRCGY